MFGINSLAILLNIYLKITFWKKVIEPDIGVPFKFPFIRAMALAGVLGKYGWIVVLQFCTNLIIHKQFKNNTTWIIFFMAILILIQIFKTILFLNKR